MDVHDRPSPSFLTPTRNHVMVSSYVDEADVPSILMPDESMTVDIDKQKREVLNESKNISFSILPTLQRFPDWLTQDDTRSKKPF